MPNKKSKFDEVITGTKNLVKQVVQKKQDFDEFVNRTSGYNEFPKSVRAAIDQGIAIGGSVNKFAKQAKKIPNSFRVYRNKNSLQKGKNGTFYNLKKSIDEMEQESPGIKDNYKKYHLNLKSPLYVSQKEIEPFSGAPSQVLFRRWFPMSKETDLEIMDKMVADKARQLGHDGIVYGKEEIQHLK